MAQTARQVGPARPANLINGRWSTANSPHIMAIPRIIAITLLKRTGCESIPNEHSKPLAATQSNIFADALALGKFHRLTALGLLDYSAMFHVKHAGPTTIFVRAFLEWSLFLLSPRGLVWRHVKPYLIPRPHFPQVLVVWYVYLKPPRAEPGSTFAPMGRDENAVEHSCYSERSAGHWGHLGGSLFTMFGC